MYIIKMMRKINLILMALMLLPIVSLAKHSIEKPAIQGKTSYAVVVDQTTLEKCRAEIDSYKAVVESEGLPTFIVSGDWTSPEDIKAILKDLHKNNNLEGAFFIGDIPIAMVTKAANLATAFKMDEREYPLGRASVPSDRFYDDFDLEFIPIENTTDGLKHFYQLSPLSPQYIECDIYSARLRPQASNGDKYEQISKYLKKAVAMHKEHNHFDSFVSYTGYGSYSECLMAWRSEQQILHEQCPGIFEKTNNAKFIRFSMDPYMKDYVIRELRRENSDFMVIHAHGKPERQFLSEIPNSVDLEQLEYIKYDLRSSMRSGYAEYKAEAEKLMEKWGMDSTWVAGYNTPEMIKKDSTEQARSVILIDDVNGIAPNTRFVIMDCCFNGDFRYDDFIAGKYIMADGKCVVAFANSVNVLQDKSTFDQLGLLVQGIRIGNWAKYNNILESHIFGDPTFHYHAPHSHAHAGEGHHHSHDINEMMSNGSTEFWFNHLNDHNPEIQNVACIKLVENNYKGIEDILLDKVLKSEYAIVRYNALMLLEKLNHPNWHKALVASLQDSFEFTRRIAVTRMGYCGHNEFIPHLIDAFVNDYSAKRVKFNIVEALNSFDTDLVIDQINKYFADKNYYSANKYKKELISYIEDNAAARSMKIFSHPDAKQEDKIYTAKKLRNRPYHQNIDEYIQMLEDESVEPIIKQYIVESLGWFRRSFQREKILSAVERMIERKEFTTPDMEKELIRARTKLTSVK